MPNGYGWAVLPCRGKRPLTGNGVHDASRDIETIARWWREHPMMTNAPGRRRWREREIAQKVTRAVLAGERCPREAAA